MSESDRRRDDKIGLILAAVVAAIICAALVISAWKDDREYKIEAENRAADYGNSARIEAQRTCPPSLPYVNCVLVGERSARPDQRGEYDLEAQRTVAAWTRAMGIAAVIGMGVGIFGLGLIYRTFAETRRSADEARNNVIAFKEAERARVIITLRGGGWWSAAAQSLNLPCNIVNFGKSAARVHSIALRRGEELIIPDLHTFDGYERVDQTIAAEGEQPRDLQVLQFPRDGYVSGYVLYDTTFGKLHRSFFAFRIQYDPPGGNVIALSNIHASEHPGQRTGPKTPKAPQTMTAATSADDNHLRIGAFAT